MGEGSQYLDIVLFAMVAVFLGLRLRSVLGRRTGNEKPMPGPGAAPPTLGRVIDARPVAVAPTPAAAGLAAIAQVTPGFTPESFIAGARGAFEMIVHAFGQGDEATLRGLLADDVFRSFSGAIRARREAGEAAANELEQIVSAEIVDATLQPPMARVTVRFVSRQRLVTRDAAGKVVEGDPDHPVEIIDLWTFARDQRSRDPNWLLSATRTPEE